MVLCGSRNVEEGPLWRVAGFRRVPVVAALVVFHLSDDVLLAVLCVDHRAEHELCVSENAVERELKKGKVRPVFLSGLET